MTGPNYDLTSAWLENINKVRDKPLSRIPYLRQMSARTGISFEVLRYNLCTDDMAAVHYAKDPRKQNAHERIAADWIKKIPGISNFQKLKASGEKALYLLQGDVLSAPDKKGLDTPKSIDFSWELRLPGTTEVMHFYASHKHTGIDGGSQDNQFADLRHFTMEASFLQQEKHIRLLSLADGEYYQKYRGVAGNKLAALRSIADKSPYASAMACAELPAYLAACLNSLFKSLSPQEQGLIKSQFETLIEKIHDYS